MSKILNQHPSNNFFQIARLSRKNLLRSVLFLIIPLVLLFLLRSFDFQRDEKILAQENKIMQDEYVGVLQAPEYRETEYSLGETKLFLSECIDSKIPEQLCQKLLLATYNLQPLDQFVLLKSYCIEKSLKLFRNNSTKTDEFCTLLIRGGMIVEVLDKDWYHYQLKHLKI
jgi:hypothetical protein